MPTHKRLEQRFMCLRDEFRTSFPWNHAKLTREGFRRWARTEHNPPIHVTPHEYGSLRAGRPVSEATVAAFAEFVAARNILPRRQCLPPDMAESCGPPGGGAGAKTERLHPIWSLGWKRLQAQFMRPFSIDEEAYCRDEEDLRLAARIVMEYMPSHEGADLSGRAAIAAGERIMGRSYDHYVGQLLTFWQANEHSVMFATLRQGKAVERVGVNVIMPVTEDYRRRLYARETSLAATTPADLAPRSRCVILHDVAENLALDVRRDKARRSMAIACTVIYQHASLLLPVEKEDCQPHIVSIAGTGENERRLRAYGFRSVGVKHLLDGKELMELVEPKKETHGTAYVAGYAEYLALMYMIRLYQIYIMSEEKQLPAE